MGALIPQIHRHHGVTTILGAVIALWPVANKTLFLAKSRIFYSVSLPINLVWHRRARWPRINKPVCLSVSLSQDIDLLFCSGASRYVPAAILLPRNRGEPSFEVEDNEPMIGTDIWETCLSAQPWVRE